MVVQVFIRRAEWFAWYHNQLRQYIALPMLGTHRKQHLKASIKDALSMQNICLRSGVMYWLLTLLCASPPSLPFSAILHACKLYMHCSMRNQENCALVI